MNPPASDSTALQKAPKPPQSKASGMFPLFFIWIACITNKSHDLWFISSSENRSHRIVLRCFALKVMYMVSQFFIHVNKCDVFIVFDVVFLQSIMVGYLTPLVPNIQKSL